VSSVNATPTFFPFTYPQSYPLPPPAPVIPPPWSLRGSLHFVIPSTLQ
jgi:hypothetical protein